MTKEQIMYIEERSDTKRGERGFYQSNDGFALVTVLFIVSLLAVIGITLNRSGGMQATISHNLTNGEKAYYIANAGLQHAFFALSADPTLQNEIFSDLPFGGGSYTVSVTQENTPFGSVLISSTGKMGTAERTINKRDFPTSVIYATLLKDTTVTKENKTYNYGASTYVKIGITSIDRQQRAILHFDLSSLPAGITIKAAIFELYMYDRERTIIGTNTINAVVHRINDTWDEGEQDGFDCTVGATWQTTNCSTNWSGGGYDTTVQTNLIIKYDEINAWHTWNISSLVQYWYDNPSSNYGLIIKDNVELGNTETFIGHFASDEYGDVNLRPKLMVYYRES